MESVLFRILIILGILYAVFFARMLCARHDYHNMSDGERSCLRYKNISSFKTYYREYWAEGFDNFMIEMSKFLIVLGVMIGLFMFIFHDTLVPELTEIINKGL